jgi:hypothetical protein
METIGQKLDPTAFPPELQQYRDRPLVDAVTTRVHHKPQARVGGILSYDIHQAREDPVGPSIVFSWNLGNVAEFIEKLDVLGDDAPPSPPFLDGVGLFKTMDADSRSELLMTGILVLVMVVVGVDVIGGIGGTVGLTGEKGPLLEAYYYLGSLQDHPWFRAAFAVSPGVGGPLATLEWVTGPPACRTSVPVHFGFPLVWGRLITGK